MHISACVCVRVFIFICMYVLYACDVVTRKTSIRTRIQLAICSKLTTHAACTQINKCDMDSFQK